MFKKLVSLLLCCLAVLAVGCGAEPPAPSGEANNTAPSAEQNTAAATEAPTEPAGKSYCRDYKNVNYNSMTTPVFAETDDAFYLLNTEEHILYFTDKEYKDWMPLCGKPDCEHKGRDCNAYMDSESLILYDRYLYYIEGSGQQFPNERPNYKVQLCRMRLDGTSHETVCDLRAMLEPEHKYRVDNCSWNFYATGKYIIARVGMVELRGQSTYIGHNYYYSIDLDTMQFIPVLEAYRDDPDHKNFIMYEARGSHAYGDLGALMSTQKLLVDLDLATGEVRELTEFDGEIYYYERGLGLVDNTLYFRVIDPLVGEMYSEAELMHLYALDIETGELTLVTEETAVYTRWDILDADAGYWYGMVNNFGDEAEYGLYVCDLDRNVIAFIPRTDFPEELMEKVRVGIITEDYIFAPAVYTERVKSTEGEWITVVRFSDDRTPTWYLIKAEIGTPDFKWHKWEP